MFSLLLIIRQYFLTINFEAFGFIMLSDLNCNPNNFVEILLISVFLVDCSNSSLSGSILLNLQLISCSIDFCRFIL